MAENKAHCHCCAVDKTKICKTCKLEKKICDYDKRYAVCKACRKLKNQNYYLKNKYSGKWKGLKMPEPIPEQI